MPGQTYQANVENQLLEVMKVIKEGYMAQETAIYHNVRA
jgi:hypothetical protein